MRRICLGLLVALLVGALAACSDGAGGASATAKRVELQQVDVRGAITHMRQASVEMVAQGIVGVILVEGAGDDDTRFASADVNVTGETRILIQGESGTRGFGHLAIGQRVEVQFDGAPKEGDPPLGAAMMVIIIGPDAR